MSGIYSDPTPDNGAQEPQKPGELQEQTQPEWMRNVDLQQPLREYASSGSGNNPGTVPPPSTIRPVYPPVAPNGRPAEPANFPQSAGAALPTYPAQPGVGAYPGQPGSPAQPGTVWPTPGAQPGMSGATPYPGQISYTPPGYPLPPYVYGYYGWQPAIFQPRRDTYTFVVGIIAFIGSCLTVLGGLVVLGFLLLLISSPNASQVDSSTLFAGEALFIAIASAGIVGGGFCIYHCSRSLFMRKPSAVIWLPSFWLFLAGYLVILGLGYLGYKQDVVVRPTLTGLLIFLAATFPALMFLALGVRRLRQPTTWRRLTLAMVSGATLAIALASVLELIFELILIGTQGNGLLQSLINSSTLTNMTENILLLIMAAVIAPVVEESVKPLGMVVLIGRVRNKAEAFALGMACGIGFNLIETTGYISQGYTNWFYIALIRSGAGLLHGFGAAMVALGWYCLTHKEEGVWQKRLLLACGCAGYAIFQHALWNSFWGLALLPSPIGNVVSTWTWNLGTFSLDIPTILNIVEMVGILIFFIYMTGRLRPRENIERPVSHPSFSL